MSFQKLCDVQQEWIFEFFFRRSVKSVFKFLTSRNCSWCVWKLRGRFHSEQIHRQSTIETHSGLHIIFTVRRGSPSFFLFHYYLLTIASVEAWKCGQLQHLNILEAVKGSTSVHTHSLQTLSIIILILYKSKTLFAVPNKTWKGNYSFNPARNVVHFKLLNCRMA